MTDTNQVTTDLSNQNSIPATNVTTETAPQTQDELVPQSKVNKLVGHAKLEAYEKGKAEALRGLQEQKSARSEEMQMPQNQTQEVQNWTPEKLKSFIADVNQQQQINAVTNHIASQWNMKIHAGKEKYSDFDQKVTPFIKGEIEKFPHVVLLTSGLDNGTDFVYEIGNNPEKLLELEKLESLAQRSMPAAQSYMLHVSEKLKQNEAAKKAPNVNEPLSQLKASTIGKDNGSLSLSDLRKQPWLRG